jgi:metal-dependent amidase/aminoacylase/carboxypeptidase family protein
LRRDIHAHPELAFTRTAPPIWLPASWTKLRAGGPSRPGQTGVVGVLRAGTSARMIGLRADMDALPLAN